MAPFMKTDNGKIRGFVTVGGLKASRTFPTKQKAKSWAAEKEVDLRKSDGLDITFTLGQLFDKYSREISPTKKGVRWEQVRLALLQRYEISKIKLVELTREDLEQWIDERLKQV